MDISQQIKKFDAENKPFYAGSEKFDSVSYRG